jgi:hypothetical protein
MRKNPLSDTTKELLLAAGVLTGLGVVAYLIVQSQKGAVNTLASAIASMAPAPSSSAPGGALTTEQQQQYAWQNAQYGQNMMGPGFQAQNPEGVWTGPATGYGP